MTRQPVSTIRNLGPKSDAAFARAGIDSADALREMGAEEAYRRLLRAGSRPHFIAFYALVMGLQGRAWNDAIGAEKAALRQRFDDIVAEEKGRPDIEAALDFLGVGKRR